MMKCCSLFNPSCSEFLSSSPPSFTTFLSLKSSSSQLPPHVRLFESGCASGWQFGRESRGTGEEEREQWKQIKVTIERNGEQHASFVNSKCLPSHHHPILLPHTLPLLQALNHSVWSKLLSVCLMSTNQAQAHFGLSMSDYLSFVPSELCCWTHNCYLIGQETEHWVYMGAQASY